MNDTRVLEPIDEDDATRSAAELTAKAAELLVTFAERLLDEARPLIRVNRELVRLLAQREGREPVQRSPRVAGSRPPWVH